MATLTRSQLAERAQAIDALRAVCPPGTRVYTILRHVSASGMRRAISASIQTPAGIRNIDHLIGIACGYGQHKHGGLILDGCGMDMGFDLVYNLSYALYPGEFTCTGPGCPSNDHSNGDRDFTPHQHHSRGYALHQEWL